MILLDTHMWLWWVQDVDRLTKRHEEIIQAHESEGLGVSIFSCWEIAKLVELKRITLPLPITEWLALALNYPNIKLLPLTPEIVVDSTQLPNGFHRDPADQIIVATSRVHKIPLLTVDGNILIYPHVDLAV